MFGFGLSPKDKWVLNQVETMVLPLATLIGQDAKALARKLFDQTKTELSAQYGDGIYAEDLGNKLIASKKDLVTKRLAAGLTAEDIREYWNQPLLMQALQTKFLQVGDYVLLEAAMNQGKSKEQIDDMVRGWRKTKPRWGDPDHWDPALPVNQGFTAEDADVYAEFIVREGRWREKTPPAEQQALLAQHTSYNAMMRALVRSGRL